MNRKHLLSLALGLVLLMSSCKTSSTAEPTPTTWRPLTATPEPPPTSQIQPTLIPTQTFTTLSTRAEIPCREGPSDLYDRIVTLPVDGNYKIIGKTDTFWLIQHSVITECWVADQQVNIQGDISAIPSMEVPPLVLTPVPPAAPENIKLKVACKKNNDSYIDEVSLTWTDTSNNEDGFRIYRDGNLAAQVPANTTNAIIVGTSENNLIHYYYIVAYNKIGEAKSEPGTIFCKKWE